MLFTGVRSTKSVKVTSTPIPTSAMAANEPFKSRLIRDMKRVIELLSDRDCELIRPISVDYNLIEVNQGYRWSIEE